MDHRRGRIYAGARARTGIIVRNWERLCRIARVFGGAQRALCTCDFCGGSIRFGGRDRAKPGADCRLDSSVRYNRRPAASARPGPEPGASSHTRHAARMLWREWRHQDGAGRITRLRALRLASLADRHLLVQCVEITPENYSGRVSIDATLSGPVVRVTSRGTTVALATARRITDFDRSLDALT